MRQRSSDGAGHTGSPKYPKPSHKGYWGYVGIMEKNMNTYYSSLGYTYMYIYVCVYIYICILELHGDDGKGNGNYYTGVYRGLGFS